MYTVKSSASRLCEPQECLFLDRAVHPTLGLQHYPDAHSHSGGNVCPWPIIKGTVLILDPVMPTPTGKHPNTWADCMYCLLAIQSYTPQQVGTPVAGLS